MLELIVFVALAGVFWRYGKQMGSGRYLSLGLYISACLGLWANGIFLITPMLAAIPTGILVMILSCMNDKQRVQRIRSQRE
ncbi:MAG: hypothetical protein ACOCYP_08260 [Planctomycetota bacterium]